MVLKKIIKKATKKATKKAVVPKEKPFKNIYTGKKLPKNVKDLILKRSKALKKTQKDFMIKKAISEKPIKAAIKGLKIGVTRDEDRKIFISPFPRYAPLAPSEKRGLKTRFNQVGGKRKLGITFDEFKDFYRYNSNRNTFLASKEVIINGEKHNVFIDFKKHNAIDVDKKALANFRKKGDIKVSNEKKGKK